MPTAFKPPKSAIRDTVVVGGPAPESPITDSKQSVPDSKPDTKAQPKPPETSVPQYRPGHIAKALTRFYGQIGLIVKVFDSPTGDAVLLNAQKCAESLEQLAQENPSVRRFIESLVTTNAWLAVVFAHLPIVLSLPPIRKNVARGLEHLFGSADEIAPDLAGLMTAMAEQARNAG